MVKKNNFMAPFYGSGSTASRLQPLRGGTLLFTLYFLVEYQTNKFPDPVINKSQGPLKFSETKHSAYVPAKFNPLFFICCFFRKWDSHD